MLEQIKRLGSDTAVYGVGTVMGRFLNVLLIPVYTNILTPADLGLVTYVYSLTAMLFILYAHGLDAAYLRHASGLEAGAEGDLFTTPLLSLLITSAVFSGVIILSSSPILAVAGIADSHRSILFYGVAILALDAAAIVPLAKLRLERRAMTFAVIKFAGVLATVGTTVMLLVVVRTGIDGVFIGGLAGSAVTAALLLPTIGRHLRGRFRFGVWRSLFRFGLPLIPAGIAAQAVQVIDRPLLRAMTDEASVGIYQANYRLGFIMMLLLQVYDFGWRPFFLQTAADPEAKRIFARVLTYLVLVMCSVFLAVAFFIREAVAVSVGGHFLVHPDYWPGLPVVPIVLGGYLFLGITINLAAGIHITKRTRYMLLITIVGAVVNIAANLLFIPHAGILGAAWATFAAYFVMAATTYVVTQNIYPIPCEWPRLAKIALATAVAYGASLAVPDSLGTVGVLGAKAMLLGLFGAMIAAMNVFNSSERSILRRVVHADRQGGVSRNGSGEEAPGQERRL